MSSRGKARKAAVEFIFEADQRGVRPDELARDRRDHPVGDAPVRDYTIEIVDGVWTHRDRIDDLIATYSRGWALERMPAIDRAVVRAAVWEIVFNDEVPDGVAVAEAVELATMLSTEKSPRFVNGLLSRISEVSGQGRPEPGEVAGT